jgi:hypothetical protein
MRNGYSNLKVAAFVKWLDSNDMAGEGNAAFGRIFEISSEAVSVRIAGATFHTLLC